MKNFVLPIFALIISYSCQNNIPISTNPAHILSFSTDTVQFDTVFTTIGTTTHMLKFYNKNSNPVKTNIQLAGGANSNFRINIDGNAKNSITNYEIKSNDSAFIFINATIDPQNTNNPMVIKDSISFITNGTKQNVKVIAYGQDVHLYNGQAINTETWINDKPYLIYNSILINKNEKLTIKEGVQVHFHNESGIIIQGTLNVEGTNEHRVVFQGDRLEEKYAYNPGQWYQVSRNNNRKNPIGGLFFLPESKNNHINYAIIKNGAIGINLWDTMPNNNTKIELSNSIITNMSGVGLFAQYANMVAYNSVFGNCNYHAINLSLGGNSEFYHCTVANYYTHEKAQTAAIALNNYYNNNNTIYAAELNTIFGNCIVDGAYENNLLIDIINNASIESNILFDNCLLKIDQATREKYSNNLKNSIPYNYNDTLFIETATNNYHLRSTTAAINKGLQKYSDLYPTDLDENNRVENEIPDLGAYEFREDPLFK